MKSHEIFNLGQDYFAQGRLMASIETFTRAHDSGYDPVSSYLSRGVAYMKKKDFAKAIDDFTAVVTLDPDNDRGYYYRGVAYLDRMELEKALEDLNHSIALNNERGTAYLARAIVESGLGCQDDAVRDFKAAVVYSEVEMEGFAHALGTTHTLFDRSMALLEGERGPLSAVLNEEEIKKLEKWIEH